MITRTFTKHYFDVVIFDESEFDLKHQSAYAFGSLKQATKAVRKNYIKNNVNICNITHVKEETAVYGLPESKFLEIAEIIKSSDSSDSSDSGKEE